MSGKTVALFSNVDSAFNALNVYKGEVYFNGVYSGNSGYTASFRTDYDCEHVRFHESLGLPVAVSREWLGTHR